MDGRPGIDCELAVLNVPAVCKRNIREVASVIGAERFCSVKLHSLRSGPLPKGPLPTHSVVLRMKRKHRRADQFA